MEPFSYHYDYDSAIFSPDGRLFQVEYAREAIKRGATTMGLKFKEGVVLAAYKNMGSNLIENSSTDKIVQIDKNIACAYIGLSADARHLVDYSQEIAGIYRIWYDEPMMVKDLIDEICRYKHLFTLYNGLRPFGLVLIVGGIDIKGIHLFGTDPSGAFLGYKAICEGEKGSNVTKYLEKNYKENMSLDKALNLVIDSFSKISKKEIEADDLEIGIIEKDTGFYKLSKKDIKKLL